MNRSFLLILSFFLLITFTSCNSHQETEISLAGTWQFSLDPDDKGMDALPFDQTIKLPGSLQNQGFGNDIGLTTKWTGGIQDSSYYKSEVYAPYRQKGNIKVPFWLNPTKQYVGAAWYRHEITIPSDWKGEDIYFCMERPHFESTVYLDGNCLGSANSLSTPHQYELKNVSPGKHLLTVKIDNRLVIPVGVNSHSVSDHTQTNWNGIIGSIKLEKRPQIHIDYLTIEPDIKNKKIQVTWNLEDPIALQARSIKKMIQPGVNQIQMDYAMGNNPLLWDEFHPNLYTLQATLKTKGVVNVKTESFGMHCINKEGRRFTMNGHPIFLRGTLDCCTFPYTGYPSMNQAYWHKIFSQVKAYGWKASETFEADVQIAHFEESIATSTPIEWKLTNGQSLCYFVLEEGSTTIKQR